MTKTSPLRHPPDTGFGAVVRSPALVAAILCVFLGAIDLTIVAAVLPEVIRDLGINTADIDRYIWAVNGYLIAYVVAIPAFGRLSDATSRRRALQIALAIFLIGSVACAIADSLADLVIGRTVQGLGGGGLLPVTMALVGDRLPRRLHIGGLGLVGALETLGWVVGPLYGAGIVTAFDGIDAPWRLVFWLNVPVVLIAIVAIQVTVGEGTFARRIRTAGTPNLALLTTALIAANLALTSGAEFGTTTSTGLRALGGTPNPLAGWTLPLLAVAGAGVVAFVVLERRVSEPLLPREFRRSRIFVSSLVGNSLVGAGLMITLVNVPVIVALLATTAETPGDIAITLAPFTLAMALFSLLAERLSNRRRPPEIIVTGLVSAAAGMTLIWSILEDRGLADILPALALAGAGMGLVLPLLSAVVLADAHPAQRGTAASFAMMFRLLGMTLGLSAVSAVAVRRLQTLTAQVEPISRTEGESTASFLLRQQTYIQEIAIPLAVQVVRETFLVAAGLMLVAILPLLLSVRGLPGSPDTDNDQASRDRSA